MRMSEVIDRARVVLGSTVVLGLVIAAVAYGQASAGSASSPSSKASPIATASQAVDDEVVLPTRVDAAIERTLSALDRSEARVDDQQYGSAAASLAAIDSNLIRAHSAARAQMRVPVDPEAETTPGPDSVLAVLNLERATVTRLAGLYDTVTDPVVLNRFGEALNTALTKRDLLLNKVIKLNPVGAGAAYADGMADSLDWYADEVANLTEALHVDHLTTSARAALTNALSRSQATAAKVTAAFGGGD
jgi:hypothetical protein